MKNNSIISKLQISGKLRQTFGNAGKPWDFFKAIS
jgi:hypothetical protein